MGQFMYYIPSRKAPVFASDPLLMELGVKSVIGDRVTCVGVAIGPDSGGGQLLRRDVDDTRLLYRRDEQVWYEWRGYFVGYWRDSPPTPKDLLRAEWLTSHRVKLRDGNEWLVPIVRRCDGQTEVPSVTFEDKDGRLVVEVDDRYKFFADIAEREFQQLLVDSGNQQILTDEQVTAFVPLTDADLFDAATRLLGLNYHIGKAEVAALRLLTKENVADVCGAMIDLPTLVKISEEMKKRDDMMDDAGKKKDSPGDAADESIPCVGGLPEMSGLMSRHMRTATRR